MWPSACASKGAGRWSSDSGRSYMHLLSTQLFAKLHKDVPTKPLAPYLLDLGHILH